MKRSEINTIYKEAKDCFIANGWALPPEPAWDITDFGLADFTHFGRPQKTVSSARFPLQTTMRTTISSSTLTLDASPQSTRMHLRLYVS
jgi:D-lyxose ketol-isomerase